MGCQKEKRLSLTKELLQAWAEELKTNENERRDLRNIAPMFALRWIAERACADDFPATPSEEALNEWLKDEYDQALLTLQELGASGKWEEGSQLYERIKTAAKDIGESLNIPERFRDANFSMNHAGQSIDKTIEKAKSGDVKAIRRLASSGKDWGEVPWFREVVDQLDVKERTKIERYLSEDKVSRKHPNPHEVVEQKDLDTFLGLFRPELKDMSHRDIRQTLISSFPSLKADPKFDPYSVSTDPNYKHFRDWLRSKGLTKGGKGGRPQKK